MKNVTVTMDEETAAWVRARAAGENKSLSRYLADLLHRTMRESHEYEEAMTRFLSKKPTRLSEGGDYPGRAELYDRPQIR